LQETIADLKCRIEEPDLYGAAGKLQRGILNNGIDAPLDMKGEEFNRQAEQYYRNDLRKEHMREAWQILVRDVGKLERESRADGEFYPAALREMMGGQDTAAFLDHLEEDILEEKAPATVIAKLLQLMILTIHADRVAANRQPVAFSPQVLAAGGSK
jgi:hypothetical protein